jgi:branched-subunit amino acid transport protein
MEALLPEQLPILLVRKMATNIVLAILVTSGATYLSRFLGVLSSEKINETSKMFRWFNCLAYSTLAALITRIVIFPAGILSETGYLLRFIVIILSLLIFYLTKKNLVYPTVFSAIILTFISWYFR